MRIAVLIYGRLTNCFDNYNNIINSIGKENNIDIFMSSDNSHQNDLDNFIRTYNPVKYNNDKIEYECDLIKYDEKKRSETNIHNMTCHFINKSRVFSLLETHIKTCNINYDIVISIRVDIHINNKFVFSNIEDNTIYIPDGSDFNYPAGANTCINDQIAYGNLIVMKKYNNLFNNIINLLENKLSVLHPESLTCANIHYYNLKIVRTNLSYHIKR
jgi:hypothetical protein